MGNHLAKKRAPSPGPGAYPGRAGSGSLKEDGARGARSRDVPNSRSVFLQPDSCQSLSTSFLTWNVAAVNNNPFEYWISYDDPMYLELMQGVECFLDEPAEHDVAVDTIFTEEMFQELRVLMEKENIQDLEFLEKNMWRNGVLDLANRRIVTQFIKDPLLGSKRLISMPDRVTNTINVVTRKTSMYRPPPACRPCVINNFEGDLSTKEVWWEQWKKFMFDEVLTVRTRNGVAVQRPVEMLEPIPRSKYPKVTEEEERLAIPLQILCQAIFDVIIVNFMNLLSPENNWQVVKAKISDRLYRRKQQMTIDILDRVYNSIDILCLQEVAAVFKDTFEESRLAATHELVLPMKLDGKRDQNSMIILRKDAFVHASIKEVTSQVASYIQGDYKFADGDLVVVEAQDSRDGRLHLIVAFHGDTSGHLTVPLIRAVHEAVSKKFTEHLVILGLDANVYEKAKDGRMLFDDFITEINEMRLTTCFGTHPDINLCRTTCSARTSLQPQLNKAVRHAEKKEKCDANPKDTIVFYRQQFACVSAEEMGRGRQVNPLKDNTGSMTYLEDSIFPTLDFPSDHGIVACCLRRLV